MSSGFVPGGILNPEYDFKNSAPNTVSKDSWAKAEEAIKQLMSI